MKKLLSVLLFALGLSQTAFSQTTIRPSSETVASAPNSDDSILIDGPTYGVRALQAAFYLNATNIDSGVLGVQYIAPSVTNGQILTTVGGAAVWAAAPGGGNVNTSGTITTGYIPVWNGATTIQALQYLPAGNEPGFTGDVTKAAGSVATTVSTLNGKAVSLGGSLTTSGAFGLTFTLTGTTALTLPTSGTLIANPMTTQYDIIVAGASGTPTRAAAGANGTFWGVSGGVAGYYSLPGGGNVSTSGTITSGYVPTWNSGTGLVANQYLPAANMPAFSGDFTTSPGSTVATLIPTGPGITTAGSTTTVPVITIDAKGRVTALTTAAISGGGGIPSGGTTYQRLAKNSATNGDAGWYSEPWVFQSDYSSLQAAFTAAANAHGTLILNAGVTALPSGGLVLPAGFTGAVGIKGLGKKVTVLQQSNASDGLYFNESTGGANAYLNTVTVSDLSIVSNNSGCARALVFDHGTTSQGSVENFAGDSVSSVEIRGGGWNSGVVFLNAWHGSVTDLYAAGDSAGSGSYYNSGTGIGQGSGIVLSSCVNFTLENLQLEWWYNGISIPSTSLDSQGMQISNYEAVECMQMVNSYGTIYMTNFLFDDGNAVPRATGGHQVTPVLIQGSAANGSYLGNGQILVNTGVCSIELSSTNYTKIVGVDLEYESNVTKAIWCTGSTAYTTVTSCNFGGATGVYCDSTSSNNYAKGNVPESCFDGTGNNALGDVCGTSNAFTVPSSPGTAFYFSTPITGAGLGKKPASVIAECVDDPTYHVQYDYNGVGGTTTSGTVWLKVSLYSGGSMASFVGNTHRFNVTVTP